MQQRPIIKLNHTLADKAAEVSGWLSVAILWLVVATNYGSLPDTVPIHYNDIGQADRFGNKATIFLLPAIATVLYSSMTALNRHPHIFNYPATITPENAASQYTLATRIIRYLKLLIVIVFGYITLSTIRQANGLANGLGSWFLPVALGLIFIPLLFSLLQAVRLAPKQSE